MATKTLAVVITGDAAGAQKAFQTTSSASDGLSSKLEAAGKKMASVGKNLSIGITAPVVAFAAVGFKELEESGKVAAQTGAVIKSTGGAANVTAKQVANLANALMEKSGIDDEAIASGENLLLSFTRIRNETGKGNDIFNQATKAALDLSVAFGKDMTQSAVLVGKALNDPIKGVTALQKVGVTFTQTQKDMIKSLVESGDVMGAQKIILKELQTEVGGSAKAYGETMAGQVSRAKEELTNAAAAMVTVAAPAIKLLGDGAMELAGFLSGLSEPAKTAVGAFAAVVAAIGPLLFIGGKIISFGSQVVGAFKAIASAAETLALKAMYAEEAVKGITLAQIGAVAGTAAVVAGFVAAAAAIGYPLHLLLGGEGFGGLMDKISEAKTKGQGWADTIIAGAKASTNPLDELRARLETLRTSQAALKGQVDSGHLSNEQAIADSVRYHVAIEGVKGAIANYKQEEKEAKAAEDARKQAVNDLANGTTNLATTTDAARTALQNFQSAMLASAGGAIGYQQSLINQQKAQADLNQAITDYGPDSAQAQAATLALNAAQLQSVSAANNMDKAQQDLIASLANGNTTYDQQIGLLYAQILAHPENAAGIQLEVNKLNDAKAAADALPGSKSIDVNVNDNASWKIDELQIKAMGLTQEEYTIMVNVGGDALGYLSSDRNIKRDVVPVRWR